MKKWLVVIILAFAQFVMVLDSTVMNVSISKIVTDLNTTVTGLQIAITLYTLVMAALMLTGGKLGDKYGRLNTFKYGLLIYGMGSLITGLSTGLPMLLAGWSFVEGVGAVMVVPSIAALVAVNYKSKDRVVAYSIIGGVSGAAAAAGPLIGGALTTYFSWRYVFIAETIIACVIFAFFANKIKDITSHEKLKIDILGVFLSSVGLFLIVLAILQTKIWGWIKPISVPVISGKEITPFGFSPVPFMITVGIAIMCFFWRRQKYLIEKGKSPLLDVSVLKNPHMQSGLSNITIQYLLTNGLFFILPIYLQMVLGLDAFSTGLKIFPLSIALIIFSLIGARMITKFTPKKIIFTGKLLITVGMFTLIAAIEPELKDSIFKVGMFIVGGGIGLMASQIGNVIFSSVGEEKSSEVGGLQGTFQNLGSSIGTALIGSILIASLTTGFVTFATSTESTLPEKVQRNIVKNSQKGTAVVSKNDVYNYAVASGLSKEQSTEVAKYYLSAQMNSLKTAIFALVLLSLLGLLFSLKLPNELVKG